MSEGTVAADQLRLLIERIERLEEEKKGVGDDIKDVYLEGKATGYDVKIMRQIVRLRKMRPEDRQEMEAILQTYLAALGMETGSSRRTPDMFAGHDGRPDPSAPAATPEDSPDDLFMKALHLVVDHQNASASWLQRQLRIGYNRASHLIEALEKRHVVGPPNHVGKRDVLVPPNGEAHPAIALLHKSLTNLADKGITMSIELASGETVPVSVTTGDSP